MRKNIVIAVLSVLLTASTGAAVLFYRLASMQAPPPTGEQRPELVGLDSNAAWHHLVETLRQAGDATVREGLNGAPSEQDAIDRFHGLLAILSNTSRLPLNEDPARPLITVFDLQPALTKIGGNSPDAEYHSFPVAAEYRYRLTGRRSRAPFSNIQVQSMSFDAASLRPEIALVSSVSGDDLSYDADGRFEVVIARERPADWGGDFLAMDDDTFNVTVREYHHDVEAEGDPDLAVEVLGDIPPPERLTDAVVAARIRQVAGMSRFWFDSRGWMPGLLGENVVNTFPDAGTVGGGGDDDLGLNVDVRYRVGAFKLAEDEVLVVAGRFPAETPYWIFQTEDRWHETVDFRSRRVHLNDGSVEVGADGRFEIVVSPEPIDHPNALDTGGRREGFMSFRWVPIGPGSAFDVTTRVARRDRFDERPTE